jgi:cytochrome P450
MISSVGSRVPPGPDGVLSIQDVQRNPLALLPALHERYGDVVRYRADRWTITSLIRPDHVKHVLQDNHFNFVKAGTPDIVMMRHMLGEGLLTSDGPAWLRQRRMAQPAFHRERLERFGSAITAATLDLVEAWRAPARDGRVFDIPEQMTHLTTRILAQAIFGVDIEHELADFFVAVQAMNEYMGHFDPRDFGAMMRFKGHQMSVHEIVDAIIEKRRNAAANGRNGDDSGSDFLALLLNARDEDGSAMEPRQLRDQVTTLLMAGHETTAKALSWTWLLIDRHPEVLSALLAEIATLGGRTPGVSDLAALPYTQAVVQEAMRLYPPVWIITRRATEEDEVGGFTMPAGSLIVMSAYVIHRQAEWWPDPERFDPARFVDAAPRHPFAYFPFSAGPRQCIGKGLVAIEAPLVVATILQHCRLAVPRDHRVETEALISLTPKGGLPATIEFIDA